MPDAMADNGSGRTVLSASAALVIVVWPDRIELPLLNFKVIARAELTLLRELTSGKHENIQHAVAAATGGAQDDALLRVARKLLNRGGVAQMPSPAEPRVAQPRTAVAATEVPFDYTQTVCLESPLTLRPVHGVFEFLGHDGDILLALSIDELLCLPLLARPDTLSSTAAAIREQSGLDLHALTALCARLQNAGLLRVAQARDIRHSPLEARRLQREAFAHAAARADAQERERQARTGRRRTQVIPVSFTNGPPLALGLIFEFCIAQQDGQLCEALEFRHDWEWDDDRLDAYTAHPAIYLCSAYVWSHLEVLRVAEAVKARSPRSLVVVGGPDAPKREGATLDYLRDHPQVDAVVRGEGEWSAFELLAAISARDCADGFDLAALAGIAGVTVRAAGEVVRGPDRARMEQLDIVPSPFLSGAFDTYAAAPLDQVIIESNRGCPYGCTFCDWGSATLSKIRKFDLERVLGEVAWTARAGTRVISFADANFGVFARDVQITEAVVAARAATGYPRAFGANFAKSSVQHLRPIIRALVEGGIVNRGLLALQTMDDKTLDTIERANIPVAKYESLAAEMRAAGLPFAVELMMGLPGATVASFKEDMQQCIDREVEGTVNPTSVLVNSPMNAPDYLREHRIETAQPVTAGRHALLVSTATFSRDDYAHMCDLRQTFLLAENFGMTRHINRLVRYSTGLREIDFLEQLHADVAGDADSAYPLLAMLLRRQSNALVVPISWRLVVDELVAYVRATFPAIHTGALATVARVQHALLPAFDRHYPQSVALEHDYPAWFAQMLALKESGARANWPELLPPLHSFGPGVLHVDDPQRNARSNIGCSVDHGPLLATWEHASQVGRALYIHSGALR